MAIQVCTICRSALDAHASPLLTVNRYGRSTEEPDDKHEEPEDGNRRLSHVVRTVKFSVSRAGQELAPRRTVRWRFRCAQPTCPLNQK